MQSRTKDDCCDSRLEETGSVDHYERRFVVEHIVNIAGHQHGVDPSIKFRLASGHDLFAPLFRSFTEFE